MKKIYTTTLFNLLIILLITGCNTETDKNLNKTPLVSEEQVEISIADDDVIDTDIPFGMGSVYIEKDDGTIEFIVDGNIEDVIKQFDFQYYQTLKYPDNKSTFYVLYKVDDKYIMQMHRRKHDQNEYYIDIPNISDFILIADIVPTFEGELNDYSNLDDVEFTILYPQFYRKDKIQAEGSSINPDKVFIEIAMISEKEGYIIYDSKVPSYVRSTKVIFLKP